MNTVSILKVIGIVDGALCAIIAAFGHFMPSYAPVCTFLVEVLGVAGTALGSISALTASPQT